MGGNLSGLLLLLDLIFFHYLNQFLETHSTPPLGPSMFSLDYLLYLQFNISELSRKKPLSCGLINWLLAPRDQGLNPRGGYIEKSIFCLSVCFKIKLRLGPIFKKIILSPSLLSDMLCLNCYYQK